MKPPGHKRNNGAAWNISETRNKVRGGCESHKPQGSDPRLLETRAADRLELR